MADPHHKHYAVYCLALGLLVLGASLHYGWALFPVEHQADAALSYGPKRAISDASAGMKLSLGF